MKFIKIKDDYFAGERNCRIFAGGIEKSCSDSLNRFFSFFNGGNSAEGVIEILSSIFELGRLNTMKIDWQ